MAVAGQRQLALVVGSEFGPRLNRNGHPKLEREVPRSGQAAASLPRLPACLYAGPAGNA
jgi:hypothetical protein